jgi:hypothetical protein
MTRSLDFQKGVFRLWEDEGLDALFKSTWTDDQKQSFLSMSDGEASPGQPFPYCVVEFSNPTNAGRSSGSCANDETREYSEIAFVFNVYAKHTQATPAKIAAGELASRVLKVFGGSPTESPKSISIPHGTVLLCQYVTDGPEKVGDQEYRWTISYLALIDFPVKT